MSEMKETLWRGNFISSEELEIFLKDTSDPIFQPPRLDLKSVLNACDALSKKLAAKGQHLELIGFLKKASLQEKIKRELGLKENEEIGTFRRISYESSRFERWSPLGLLGHVAPTNSLYTGFLSVIEGLLSGNRCLLKTGGSDGLVAQTLLYELGKLDPSGGLSEHIGVARISSQNRDLLKLYFRNCDGVAVWGGHSALKGIRDLVSPSIPLIEWGPKISFAFVSKEKLNDLESVKLLAKQCCEEEQLACSSPQCIYVESNSDEELVNWAKSFADVFEEISLTIPLSQICSIEEQADLTKWNLMGELETALGEKLIIKNKSTSVIVDFQSKLESSPLHRSTWIKPLDRRNFRSVLFPIRHEIQTVGLCCSNQELAELSNLLTEAGALRLTKAGSMLESFPGEAHDGQYALQRYVKKVTLQWDDSLVGLAHIGSCASLSSPENKSINAPIQTKAAFQKADNLKGNAHLYFKSGGSSGAPKLSTFTYDDYHLQMRSGGDGLYAAGLDPRVDRCINLFYGGGLYGGFISFFSVLESLGAIQFPMAAHTDLDFVTSTIVEQKINTVLGMPSYVMKLFSPQNERLRQYRGIKKLYFAGEHLLESQRHYLKENFGIEIIRSAAYGSVDAGPIGFQCLHCEDSTYHIFEDLLDAEVIYLEEDKPVSSDKEIGRLIVTSRFRSSQNVIRYDIGDLVRLVSGPCLCGRTSKRIELKGRTGDLFRVGGAFLNYQKFAQIISNSHGYEGPMQLEIMRTNFRESIFIYLSLEDPTFQEKLLDGRVMGAILDYYKDLFELVSIEKVVDLCVKAVAPREFKMTGAGKMRHIVDLRES